MSIPKLVRIVALGLLLARLSAEASEKSSVFFGNGIWTDEVTARRSSETLKFFYKDRHLPLLTDGSFNSLFQFDYAYNKTACVQNPPNPLRDPNCLLDLLEALEQAAEAGNFTLDHRDFWYILFGRSPSSLETLNALASLVQEEELSFSPHNIGDADLLEQVRSYHDSMDRGHKVLLVAHSQGNFFGNKAHDLLTQTRRRSFGLVSVATPAEYVAGGGPYTTLRQDFIHLVPGSLPPRASDLTCGNSFTCHRFLGTYLAKEETRNEILDNMQTVLETLTVPNDPPSIVITEPDGVDDSTNAEFEIRWADVDHEDNAQITLAYSASPTCAGGIEIAHGIAEDDERNTYLWGVTGIPNNSYYIQASINDGTNPPVTVCSGHPVIVNQPVVVDPGNTYSIALSRAAQQALVTPYSSSSSLNATSSQFTLETWIKTTPGAGDGIDTMIVDKSPTHSSIGYRLSIENGGFLFGRFGCPSCIISNQNTNYADHVYASFKVDEGAWHHIAMTYDQTTLRLYIDGSLVADRVLPGRSASQGGNFAVGRYSMQAAGFYDGLIDELRVWSVARTLEEIAAHDQEELSGTEAGLAGYWRFDGTLCDKSGHGNLLQAFGNPGFDPRVPFGTPGGGVESACSSSTSAPPLLRTVRTELCMISTPALGDDGVFYAAGAAGCDTSTSLPVVGIAAWNPVTGGRLWGPRTPEGCNRFGGRGASVGSNGLLYAVSDWNDCRDGRLMAINGDDGTIAWNHGDCPGGGNTSPHPRQVPALDEIEDSVYFGSTNLCSTDMISAANNWVFDGGFYIGGRGLALDSLGNIYFGTYSGAGNKITSVSSAGVLRWSINAAGGSEGPGIQAVIGARLILLNHPSDANSLVAWQASSGAPAWRIPNLSHPVVDSSGAIFAGGVTTSEVVSLNEDGSERWRVNLIPSGGGPAQVDFVDSTGHLYVRVGNVLYALHTLDGSIQWQFGAVGTIHVGTFLDADGHLVVADTTSTLYTLDTELEYASSDWPVALFGNRRHTSKAGDILSLP